MYGTFNGSLAYPQASSSKIIIKNSRMDVSTTVGAMLLSPASPVLGTTIIENSTILLNTTGSSSVGQGVWYVNNSSIKNLGTGFDMFINTTASGSLTLLNSTLVNTDLTMKTVNYVGAAPFTTANSATNTSTTATTLNGTIVSLAAINIT